LSPKEPEFTAAGPKKAKPSRAIRRLVIWYRRNAAVTSLVDTATSAASTAGTVASDTRLLITVGLPNRPLWAGSGGLART